MTAPDTNTPRDGLTDAELLLIFRRAQGAGQGAHAVSAMRAAIAADREARPAPASGLTVDRAIDCLATAMREAKLMGGDRADVLAAFKRQALAASTPPAEAQGYCTRFGPCECSEEAMPGCVSWRVDPSEARATGDLVRNTDDGKLYRKVDGEWVEARATGDAAERAAFEKWYARKLDGRELETPFKGHAQEAWLARAALSDRSTGAVPAEVVHALNVATGSNEWQGDSGPGALIEPAVAAIRRLAATGAAGEPQPREGWKWVPVEPTDAMIEAARKASRTVGSLDGDRGADYALPIGYEYSAASLVYEAMLAAAPQADSGAAGGQGDKP